MSTLSRSPYAWARQLDVSAVDESALSEAAAVGLQYADQLAWNAKERSQDPRRNYRLPKLTLQDLADRDALQTDAIEAWIAQARRELFGTLTDAAIAKRAQRSKGRSARACEQAHCTKTISEHEHGNRRYCRRHRSGKARAKRCRDQKKIPSPPTPAAQRGQL